MPIDAKVYRVLVASPGDVGEERSVIPEVINEWNAMHTASTSIILMPVKWETHTAPLMGSRPQEIINEQIVRDCDLLVGVFWTRIGTSTGVAVSGTAEEIEHFVDLKKPVMLYFSQSPVDPDKIEIDQFTILKSFKEKMRLKGLTESYNGLPDFRQRFSRQLSINIGNTIISKKSEGSGAGRKPKPAVLKEKPSRFGFIGSPDEKLTPEKIDDYLEKAYFIVARDNGWADIAAFGQYLATYTPVDYKKLGFVKLKQFLESRKLFELKVLQKSPNAKGVDSVELRLIKI